MRETKFIEQNKEKWHEFEGILKQKKADPDKLSKLFIQVTDDLSYSRTFYPNRSVRVYLNYLSQQIFYTIYKNKRNKRSRFITFWTDELPRIVWDSRKAFLLSTIIFLVSCGIGVLSSIYDPEFSRTILGDGYVEMTLENIEKGDPMGVYKDSGEMGMFTYITLNNLQVDFITFFSGLLASFGTILVMIRNGVMVGTFQYFFVEHGLFWESALTIWVHGCLEIPSIIISGAGGLVLGSGLVFPGTYTRMQSFLVSARRGIKIIMGVVPITILAGFFESFLTRYTEAPDLLRGLFILSGFGFVLFYFVYYPWRKSKIGFKTKEKKDDVPASTETTLELSRIRTNTEIFADTFPFYKPFFGSIIRVGLLLAAAFAGYYLLFAYDNFTMWFSDSLFSFTRQLSHLLDILRVLNLYGNPIFTPAVFILYLVTALAAGYGIYSAARSDGVTNIKEGLLKPYLKKHTITAFLFAASVTGVLFIPGSTVWLVLLPIQPILMVIFATALVDDNGFFQSFSRGFSFCFKQFGDFLAVHIIMMLISMLFQGFSSTAFLWLHFQALQMFVIVDGATYDMLFSGVLTFVSILIFAIVLPLQYFAYTLFYYKVREIQEAPGLMEKISLLGRKRKVYGLEQEV